VKMHINDPEYYLISFSARHLSVSTCGGLNNAGGFA